MTSYGKLRRNLFYTPTVGGTLRELRNDLNLLTSRVESCIDQHRRTTRDGKRFVSRASMIELIILDEAERLSTAALEHLRDMFDRTPLGLMLIGMPGIEKRMARYPQLYSRVGFAHHYRPLQGDERTFVLTRHWRTLGLPLDNADFTDTQAIAAISRITERLWNPCLTPRVEVSLSFHKPVTKGKRKVMRL